MLKDQSEVQDYAFYEKVGEVFSKTSDATLMRQKIYYIRKDYYILTHDTVLDPEKTYFKAIPNYTPT